MGPQKQSVPLESLRLVVVATPRQLVDPKVPLPASRKNREAMPAGGHQQIGFWPR